MSFLGQEEQLREFQDRFKFLHIALAIGIGILVARLVYLQVLQGDNMRLYSDKNRIKRVTIAAPRGMIFDRERKLLVDNQPAFDLEVTPQYLRQSENPKQVLEKVSDLIELSQSSIDKKMTRAKSQPRFLPVKLKTDLTRDEVAKIESWKIDMPGVEVQTEILRTAVYGDALSHLIGYIGKVNKSELPALKKKRLEYKTGDNVGKVGIEKQLEDTLRGVDGEMLVEVDAVGREIRGNTRDRVLKDQKDRAVVPGKNVTLTIDQDIQLAAKEAFGDKVGGLVAIKPKTGEIIAMISRPSFDPTEFSRGVSSKTWQSLLKNPDHPLRDKTIQDHYMPGSVFKVVTAIAGLEEGLITRNTSFNCKGWMKLGRRRYHCHKAAGHGDVNVITALSRSCNVFFYRLAQKFSSVDVLSKWAKKLGLGFKTDIELPREVSGLIPDEDWKKKRFGTVWNQGETLSVSIGQSFVLTTVLQLANLYATIANGGKRFKPYFLKSVENATGEVLDEFDPKVLEEVPISEKTLRLVKNGLWGAVNHDRGTAYWFGRLPGMDFVGKTGTSQVVRLTSENVYQKCEKLEYKYRRHAVFAGFAPKDNPEIAVAVLAEHQCHGSSGASPIAKAVVDAYLRKYFPEKYTEEYIAEATKREWARLKYVRKIRKERAEQKKLQRETSEEGSL